MSKNTQKQQLIDKILEAIQDTKGEDIQVLDLSHIENTVADTFIICSANSNTQVSAIAGNVEKKVRNELQDRPWHVEGAENSLWVLVDYVSVVVHIFQKHIREYYDIESLWGDAKVTKIES
ncbi:ribosome silencing factor [Elizabethkingia meningoseptica]|uniref:Ribosomal silencing factor RsfS n=1 Tax=Elizabethkingia meningoseptica TaxID=238 RepID=A0A1V3TYZ8_ELIME|nr:MULTISPECIES: ribosome silencing factor [Elizabethkingia]AQX04183.1 ribosome silencing factor [Elizabethkingia meningoseptica]AQX11643.1 ribosome silencing factor [Elizabethkingia meningoseptica]AQX46224.1 ribosome-associated protein IOJAP [Elizabethkingia meningoseptica]EJK5330315.1 ribosome silencing factor [Elizabethkingia meningoseptica]EOR30738.1 Iojap family protein [Elizabethkingia meningoseptica ATCC 13253 = NBRC 12535]